MTKFNPNSAPKPNIFEKLLYKLKGTPKLTPEILFNLPLQNKQPDCVNMRKDVQGVYNELISPEFELAKLSSTDKAWTYYYEKDGSRRFIPNILSNDNILFDESESIGISINDQQKDKAKKYRLDLILARKDIVLTAEAKSNLVEIVEGIEIDVFETERQLFDYISFETDEVSSRDIATISRILLDKNLKQ